MKYGSLIAATTAAGVVATNGDGPSPVEKVITLIDELKTESETELGELKTNYNKMACFCKDNTKTQSDSITTEQGNIDDEAATIEEQTGEKARLNDEIAQKTKDIAGLDADLKEEEERWLKESTHLAAVIADLNKAVYSLEGAHKAVKESQKEEKMVGLTALKSVVQKNLMMAEILGMSKAKQAGEAFMQMTSAEPKADYNFHSGGILETLEDLKTEFTDRRDDTVEEEAKAKKAHEKMHKGLTASHKSAVEDKETLEGELEECEKTLGQAEIDLETARAALSHAQTYLKDLTTQCELKAREFDQNYKMRNDEITALGKALDIMNDKVKGVEASRALFLNEGKTVVKRAAPVAHDVNDDDVGDLSFVQKTASKNRIAALMKATASSAKQQRTEKALAALSATGTKLHSFELLNAAAVIKNAAKGPFDKVKKLIAKLIERLLQEAADEATKKGWCDTETAKATKERDYKFTDITELNADLEGNEATLAKAKSEIERLTTEIADATKERDDAEELREGENKTNTKTIKDSRAGLEAVTEALKILKDFYKGEHGAGGADSATLSLVQESPIQEDLEAKGLAGTGEASAYTGNQDAASGILGLLNVIKSDFERSVETTMAAEKEAAAAHVKFMRETNAFLAGAETEKTNNTNTKNAMESAIKVGMEDLKSAQGCMDAAVKTLEDLQPACVDTGMSYEERVEKREAEIKALKTAHDQLCGEDCSDDPLA